MEEIHKGLDFSDAHEWQLTCIRAQRGAKHSLVEEGSFSSRSKLNVVFGTD